MSKKPFSTLQSLRIALILWIVYFFVLALLEEMAGSSKVTMYYAVQGFNGFIILVLTLLPWKPLWLERAIVPVTFALMASLPILTNHIIAVLSSEFRFRILTLEAMMLCLMPIQFMGLLLMAWHYEWRHVLLFCLATSALNLTGRFMPSILHLLPLPPPPLPPPPLPSGSLPPGSLPPPGDRLPPSQLFILVTILHTLSFLIVGYFTSALNSRLRAQQNSLKEANAQLRDQAKTRKELTISQERNRMARELHDTLAHTLSGLSLQLQTVKAYREVDPSTSEEMLDGAVVATRSGLQEVRRALKALRAAPLEDLGLSLAIREVAESVAERGKLDLRLSIPEPLPSLAPSVSQCLYRVAQEAMMNVLYHANAKRLSVALQVKDNEVQLTIDDDGVGFDVEGQYTGHWGVQGMRERAELVGGHLLIKSQRDYGTTIQLHIHVVL